MPSLLLKKYPKSTPTQGYPDDKLLQADIKTLQKCYQAENDDVTELVIGQACANVYAEVEQKLKIARGQLLKLLPDSANPNEVHVDIAKLKKNTRIMQKAVHYAACDDQQSGTLQLQKVRDILRATVSFPSSYFDIKDIGSSMIDIFDRTFNRKLVFAKNRFVESRYPHLVDFSGRELSQSLKEDIVALANNNLSGRDTFYRDIQLLIRLDKSDFENNTSMKSVLFEVQLVSNALHHAKLAPKENDGVSGHDMYKVIRAVMEYAEYIYWRDEQKREFQFDGVAAFYPKLDPNHWLNFTGFLKRMWDSYSKNRYVANLQEAIENSAWYQRMSQQQ